MGLSSHHLYTLWGFVAPVTQQGDLLLQSNFQLWRSVLEGLKKKRQKKERNKRQNKNPQPILIFGSVDGAEPQL